MANGETRSVIGIFGFLACVIGFFALISGPASDNEVIGCCCWGIIFAVVASSGSEAKKKTQQQLVVWQQQPVQQPVVIQHHYAAPVAQTQPAVNVSPPMTPGQLEAEVRAKENNHWVEKARNLEMARDWEGAAQAYQEAGLYHEAGRVRQTHLEEDKSGVNIHVKSGDTYHDSVVMKDKNSNDQNQP